MLPEVWDCSARVFMDLVDGLSPFISEYANANPPQGQGLGWSDSSTPSSRKLRFARVADTVAAKCGEGGRAGKPSPGEAPIQKRCAIDVLC